MAPLAERGQIPVFAVGLVAVQMMHGEDVPGSDFMDVLAPLAFPIGVVFYSVGD